MNAQADLRLCCLQTTQIVFCAEAHLEMHKNIGFLSNSGPDPLKDYEATESAFNVRPSLARQ